MTARYNKDRRKRPFNPGDKEESERIQISTISIDEELALAMSGEESSNKGKAPDLTKSQVGFVTGPLRFSKRGIEAIIIRLL
ncbi:hypothetical protein TrispH2_011802 [Trichoplax sp. H2]|nr:hypothetical protein TrispH2_011802 [Trichoplax sp. H2]|eukprot:RDD36624.1 hypothetical protein TrispH2_011802 [Trichoplax sp. H2]